MNRSAAIPALLATLCACTSVPPTATPPSPTLPAEPTRTSTVAFPTLIPTVTWTPGPTPTSIADLQPESGPLLLVDPMDDPSAWELATTASGGAAITDGQLTLSVRTPRAYHSARRPAPIVGDFFAEVDLYTEVCNPGDEIGLTARAGGLVEQYRFLIGCDGTARITRVLEEGSRALTLRVASPAIQAGAPTHNHLAIWLRGIDLKFFVNGEEVLTVRDAALASGNLGVIARAGPGGQVSASFDDLAVFALTDPRRTPSPPPTSNPAASPTPSS